METIDLTKYNITTKQKQIITKILISNNYKYKNEDLESFDINLVNTLKDIDDETGIIEKNKKDGILPNIVRKGHELLDCNSEYIKYYLNYTSTPEQVIKLWSTYNEHFDYSVFFPYVVKVNELNSDLLIYILRKAPYLVSLINIQSKENLKKIILFIPSAYRYIAKNNIDDEVNLALMSIKMDLNNIKFVDKKIIVKILKLY